MLLSKDCGAWIEGAAAMSTTLSTDDRYTGLKLPPVSVGTPPPLPKPKPKAPASEAQTELELVRKVRQLEEARVEPDVGSASVEPEPAEPERRPVLPELPKPTAPANFGPPRHGEWWARSLGRPFDAA